MGLGGVVDHALHGAYSLRGHFEVPFGGQFAGGFEELSGVRRGPDDVVVVGQGHLPGRDVDHGRGLAVDVAGLYVNRDADDEGGSFFIADLFVELLADWVRSGEEILGDLEGDDGERPTAVGFSEIAAGEKGGSGGGEVAGADDAPGGDGARGGDVGPFDGVEEGFALEREAVGGCRGDDAGEVAEFVEELLVVGWIGGVDVESYGLGRVEAMVAVAEAGVAKQEQAGGADEGNGEGGGGEGEGVLQAAGCVGCEPEGERDGGGPGGGGDEQREGPGGWQHGQFWEAGEEGRGGLDQDAETDGGEGVGGGGAEDEECGGFGKGMAEKIGRGGAEGGVELEFGAAAGDAGELEIGEIDGDDAEEQGGTGGEEEEGLAGGRGDLGVEWGEADAGGADGEFGFGLGGGGVGAEFDEGGVVEGGVGFVDFEGSENVDGWGEVHHFAEQFGAGEGRRGGEVGGEDGWVGRGEICWDAEDGKEVRGDFEGVEAAEFGGVVVDGAINEGDGFAGMALGAPGAVVTGGGGDIGVECGEFGGDEAGVVDAAGVGDGEGLLEYDVGGGEDDGPGGDGEGDRENGGEGEEGVAAEKAGGGGGGGGEKIAPAPAFGFAALFGEAGEGAEFETGLAEGLGGGEAATFEVGGAELDVGTELLFDFLIGGHADSVPRVRSMSSTVRRQFSDSRRSWFSPSGVRE